ncbi:9204_t:CDS:1, partial [Paraglomus occultum]
MHYPSHEIPIHATVTYGTGWCRQSVPYNAPCHETLGQVFVTLFPEVAEHAVHLITARGWNQPTETM